MESSSKSNDLNSSDLNIDYSSDSDKLGNKKSTSSQSINFDNSDNSDKDVLSDNDSSLIINLFESDITKSEIKINNSDSLEITYDEKLFNSTNEMSTNTDEYEFQKSSVSSGLNNSIVDNVVNVDLMTSTTNDDEILSSLIQSSESSFNDNIIIENSDSSKDLIENSQNSIDIKEIIDKDNKKSIGINTDELIITLKLPFDKDNIINATQVNLSNNISNTDHEERKKLELEELKRNLIKKNEMKMQKMFDILLEKQSNEIENEIENLGGPKKITKKKEVQEENLQDIDENIINEGKDKSDSDPFNMDYNLNKKNNKNNFYEDDEEKKRKDFLNKRKEEIKKLANDFKKQEIKDSIESEDNISGSSLSSKSNSEKIEKKDKDENFLKRKSERREKFLERRGLKKNILNKVFDMIYIINLEKDRKKVQPLLKKFDSHNVKYQVSDGVDAKASNYIKYFNRWLYQKDNSKYKLTKLLFDFEIYKRKNPDLEDKGITNKIRAWNHWTKNGFKEGRKLYEKTNIQNVSQLGCVLAHNRAILDAMKNGYNNILILEDDIYLDDKFFEKVENIFNNIPKWDILYFGASQKKWEGINLNNKNVYYNANNTLGTFAYGLNKSLFRPLTEYSMELIDSIDKCLQIFHHFNSCFVLYPNIIITNLENSKIHRSRDIQIYSKIYKWDLDNFDLEFYDYIEND